jgi:hypothetical protein
MRTGKALPRLAHIVVNFNSAGGNYIFGTKTIISGVTGVLGRR